VDELPVETTLYSLSPRTPAPEADRRDAERHLTLFRVGTMVVRGRRELCLIKNISAGGAMLRLYSSGLVVGEPLCVELKSGQPLSGSVTWVRDQQLGMTFARPIDVLAMLACAEDGPRPRMPRIETDAFVMVREGAEMHRLHACDISQGGIKVAATRPLTRNADVTVSLPGLPPTPGVVRWLDGDHAGITFNRLLPLPTLIDWLRQQRAGSRAA
jgi:hypothetical protein